MNTHNSETIRSKCIAKIIKLRGESEFEIFLKTPQPDFEDMTGGELLQHHPEELHAALPALVELYDPIEELVEELREIEFEWRAAQ